MCACVGGSVRQTRGVDVEEKVENTWIQFFITIRNEVSIFVCVKRESVCMWIHIYTEFVKRNYVPFDCFHVRTEYVKRNENRNPKTKRFPQWALSSIELGYSILAVM